MQTLPLAIFATTYLGMAVGRVPGLTLDRTGIALLGAIAMVVSGTVPLREAIQAIDLPTILLLYSLMVVSAQLRLGGFYTRVAERTASLLARPRLCLLATMLVAGLLSALLANDIVCLAFTPVLTTALLRAGRSPLPFLLGLACASNIGSAATIIGNPQNMLIGQVGQLHFGQFLWWCGPPSLLALLGGYAIISLLFRTELAAPPSPTHNEPNGTWPEFNRWQSSKGLIAVSMLVCLFFTPIPRELSALTTAGFLLCSRTMRSRRVMELVDWHLITLFCSLFIVVHGIASQGLPELAMRVLASQGLDPASPASLAVLTTLLSNLVSNVPAVMLLVRFLDPALPEPWYVLALASTYAGNLFLIGSIANLIVAEQAERAGLRITFAQHARVGVPVTIFSLALLLVFLYL
ncbi:MAG: anion transporter [Thermodesulfobacteriota bacterium]